MRVLALRLFQFWESLVFVTAFAAGLAALSDSGLVAVRDYAHPVFYGLFALLALLWVVLLDALGLYSSRRLVKRANEYLNALGAVTIAAGFLALLGALLGHPTNEPPFVIWFLVTGSGLMLAGRLLARTVLRTARAKGRNLRFVTIVGSGPAARQLVQDLRATTTAGYRINAVFDPAMTGQSAGAGKPRRRQITELRAHLMHDPVDEVIVTLPLQSQLPTAMEVIAMCRRVGVPARLFWQAGDSVELRPSAIETIGRDGATLVFSAAPTWGWHAHAKRAFDILAASAALLMLSPLLLLVALLIRLDSPGPVLFSQQRAGVNKQPFRFFKFRTMVQDAEARQGALEDLNEARGPVFKIRSDPRITRIGHFLRRSSIDELPQLLNVLRGDMSIVGPRPLPLRDVARFEKDWHSRRFSVKPGLTCSWVIAGRSELEFDAWMRMDLEYIDNWSFFRDIKICLLTIPVVFRGSGAY